MKCPYCGYEESKVIDSRSADDGERIRRRRECLKCGKRFTTHEVIETVPLIVVKRDKSREVFDRNKPFSNVYEVGFRVGEDLRCVECAGTDVLYFIGYRDALEHRTIIEAR